MKRYEDCGAGSVNEIHAKGSFFDCTYCSNILFFCVCCNLSLFAAYFGTIPPLTGIVKARRMQIIIITSN